MASVQEVAAAAHRIGQSAKDAQMKTLHCANTLMNQRDQLAATVAGSRTGMDAVNQVTVAERKVRESAARLQTLQIDIDRFISDLQK